jgi:branched-chain amino acid transport system ATP-binding protein
MLIVNELEVSYGPVKALRGVSLEVRKGQIVGVVGPNGAGKSSLLGAISGLVHVRSGEVEVAGVAIAGKRPEQIVRNGIALVPENRRIFPQLTVDENIRLGATIRRDRREVEKNLSQMYERFPGLRVHLNSRASNLSGGEQQQMVIARALMSKPRLLLLDEPSLGLAPVLVDVVFETLLELRNQGVTVLLAEQFVSRTLKIADYMYALDRGKVVTHGRPADLDDYVDPAVPSSGQ